MINYTQRLDNALRKAAWAHEQVAQHRKGSDIPYIIHPVAVMIIAGNVTDDEDVLIACLMHDVIEDVDSKVYGEAEIRAEFGDRVVSLVKDVTKNDNEKDWHKRSKEYLDHLQTKASDGAVIVSASDKIHNLLSILTDYETHGDDLWLRFSTNKSCDQLWWYDAILEVVKKRNAPPELCATLSQQVEALRTIVDSKS